MQKTPQLWRQLRVGDKIRLVEMPSEFRQTGYYVHRDTIAVYKKLLARRRPLRVWQIDRDGLPWIRCWFRRPNGRWEHHYLAVNHSGLVRVKSRSRRERGKGE
jgi:hypothetical protein